MPRSVEPHDGIRTRPHELADRRVVAVNHPACRPRARINHAPKLLVRKLDSVRLMSDRIELDVRRADALGNASREGGLPRARVADHHHALHAQRIPRELGRVERSGGEAERSAREAAEARIAELERQLAAKK